MMRRFLPTLIAVSLLLVAGLAAAGKPKTALGNWMQPNMGTPMGGSAAGDDVPDYATLQTSVALLLTKEPPAATYPKWDSFLQQAKTAVAAKDKPGLKAACKGCHDAYKQAYIGDPAAPKQFP